MNKFIDKSYRIGQSLVQETGSFKLFALLERATAFDATDGVYTAITRNPPSPRREKT